MRPRVRRTKGDGAGAPWRISCAEWAACFRTWREAYDSALEHVLTHPDHAGERRAADLLELARPPSRLLRDEKERRKPMRETTEHKVPMRDVEVVLRGRSTATGTPVEFTGRLADEGAGAARASVFVTLEHPDFQPRTGPHAPTEVATVSLRVDGLLDRREDGGFYVVRAYDAEARRREDAAAALESAAEAIGRLHPGEVKASAVFLRRRAEETRRGYGHAEEWPGAAPGGSSADLDAADLHRNDVRFAAGEDVVTLSAAGSSVRPSFVAETQAGALEEAARELADGLTANEYRRVPAFALAVKSLVRRADWIRRGRPAVAHVGPDDRALLMGAGVTDPAALADLLGLRKEDNPRCADCGASYRDHLPGGSRFGSCAFGGSLPAEWAKK